MKKILFCILILILGTGHESGITFVIVNNNSNNIDETEKGEDPSISISSSDNNGYYTF